MSSGTVPAHLARDAEEYTRLGIKKGEIALWEDGLRTDGGKGTYEWWYFDAHLNGGVKVVIVFYTKSLIDVDKSLAPFVWFTLDRADGTHFEKEAHPPAADFNAAREQC